MSQEYSSEDDRDWVGDNHPDTPREIRKRFDEYEKNLVKERSKKSEAWRDFYLCVDHGKTVANVEEIAGYRDNQGAEVFTAEQATRASGQMRSDTAAILAAQAFVLQRLDRNRNLMWAIIVLLLLIVAK